MGSINEAQLACAEARERVLECCPGVSEIFSCGEGCSELEVDHDRADRLRVASCNELRALGGCEPVIDRDAGQ